MKPGYFLRCFRRGVPACFIESLGLTAVAIVAFQLPAYYPSDSRRSAGQSSWRESNWQVWYQSHQIYRRPPEELSESDLEHLLAWCRCLNLIAPGHEQSLTSLTNDECQLVLELLEDICPDIDGHAGYLPIYQTCRERLDSAHKDLGGKLSENEDGDSP